MCTITQGERFKDARTVYNRHGSQSMNEVYTATGVSASMIKDLEDDEKIRSVGYDKIALLAKHYGVSADYLLGLSPYPTVDKDLEFVCKYTGLNESSVKYLRQLMDIYNGVIVHPKALKELEEDGKNDKYYKERYANLCDEYLEDDIRRLEDARMLGMADTASATAIADAQIALERKFDEESKQMVMEFYRSSAILPIMALDAILSCDAQKEILTDISCFLQMDTSKGYNGEKTAINVVMATKDNHLDIGSELPIDAIAWGYLKKAEDSLSELRNQFVNKLFLSDIQAMENRG